MATKSVDEHRTAISNLLSTLTEIERLGNDFFDKAENSLSVPYSSQAAQADVNQLHHQLNRLELNARVSGLFSLSSSLPADGQPAERKNLQTRTQDASRAVEVLYKEKERLLKNVQAASASAGRGM